MCGRHVLREISVLTELALGHLRYHFDRFSSRTHVMERTLRQTCTLLWSSNIEQAFHDAADWLRLCGVNGITLNPDKFVFAQDTVQFAGFEIGPTTARKFTRAIAEFPIPTSTTDVRSWFGLVNQVAYSFSRADVMTPFRDLLKPSTTFSWTDDHQEAFEASKRQIID